MNTFLARTAALLTTACVLVSGSAVTAFAADYNDFDYITSHVTTEIAQHLTIARPGKNIKSNTATYYITGTSNPSYDLYLNGEKFNSRGISGSFGVYMALEQGDNVFTFTQDNGDEQSVTITRGAGSGSSSGSAGSSSSSSGGGTSTGPTPYAIEVTEVSSSVFERGNTSSNFVATAKRGATDYVVDSNATMYKLAMGGWINKDTVRAIDSSCENEVSSVSFNADAGGESFTLEGTAQPIASSYRTTDVLSITLQNTTGVGSIPTENSTFFTSADVSEQDGNTTITFNRNSTPLWGYVVEYNNNTTTIYCKATPVLSGGSTPLAGITVSLDAGHGGTDPGALGIMNGYGIAERDITANTAIAVQKRLESLGATVIYTGSGTSNTKTSFVDRMTPAYEQKADFFLSLHCNSIGANQNGAKPEGIEIYYYDSISKAFSERLVSYTTSYTGRVARGAKKSFYRVTLNSCAPSVLVEMGFICNPLEFDDMASKNGIFNMANAIGDGIVSYLS